MTKEIIATDGIRVLKSSTCPSLSGKSSLTYDIGCNALDVIQFRVTANSGSGFFSKEWIAMADLRQRMDKLPKGKAITSGTFAAIFGGKSVNTSGFLLAVLKQEGLVETLADNKRCYGLTDHEPFMASVALLMGSIGDNPGAANPQASGSAKKVFIQKAKAKKT